MAFNGRNGNGAGRRNRENDQTEGARQEAAQGKHPLAGDDFAHEFAGQMIGPVGLVIGGMHGLGDHLARFLGRGFVVGHGLLQLGGGGGGLASGLDTDGIIQKLIALDQQQTQKYQSQQDSLRRQLTAFQDANTRLAAVQDPDRTPARLRARPVARRTRGGRRRRMARDGRCLDLPLSP